MLIISKKISLGTPAIADVTDVSGCVLACDWKSAFYEGASDTCEDGDECIQWSDRSGSNNHMLQSGAGVKPLYVAAWNGGKSLPALDFDGTDDYMATAGNVALSTLIAVYNWEGPSTFPTTAGLITNNASYGLIGRNGSAVASYENADAIVDVDRSRTFVMIPASTAKMAMCVSPSHAAAAAYVGRRTSTASTNWNGKIAAIYGWNKAITYTEYKQLSDLIAGWYGNTLAAF